MDLQGFSVEAIDGGIGRVDEATYETAQSYVIIDTGPWIFGKQVMLPAMSSSVSMSRAKRSSSN
jgi:hypothetical protein